MRNRRIIFTVAFSRSKSIEDFRQTYGLARISSFTFNYSQGRARDNPGKSVQMTRKIAIVGKLFSLLCLSENTFVPRHAKSFYQFIRCNVGCNVERERERESVFRTFIFCSRIDTHVRSNLFRNREPEKHKHRPINQTDIKNCY